MPCSLRRTVRKQLLSSTNELRCSNGQTPARHVVSCTAHLASLPLQLSTMRQAEFRRLWHLYKDAYVACLVACGNRYDPTLPSVQRLVRLTKELDAMHGVLVLSQPDLIMHFLNGVDEVREPSVDMSSAPTVRRLESASFHATHRQGRWLSGHAAFSGLYLPLA